MFQPSCCESSLKSLSPDFIGEERFFHFSFSCVRLRHVLRARNFPNSNTTGGAVSFPTEIEGYANVFDVVPRDWTKRKREGERTLGARLLSRALQRFGSSLIPDTNQA